MVAPMTLPRSTLCALLLAAPLSAQFNLVLDVKGGSVPGQVELRLCGAGAGISAAIFIGINPGPTPIALFDPRDPRFLQVGTELLGFPLLGIFLGDGCFSPPPIQVPNLPGLLDDPFFFQGVNWPASNSIVGSISNSRAIRMGPAGEFHDRFTSLQAGRAFFQVLPRPDDTWMLVGGGDGGVLAQLPVDTTEIYDPITDAFAAGPTMTAARSLHTATELPDGRWLITGGVDAGTDPQNTCEIYDPVTNQFTAIESMTANRMGHTATLLANGKVLVAGGISLLTGGLDSINSTLSSTEIFDPATGKWSAGPGMTTPRAGQMAIVLADGRVALAGGISFDTIFILTFPAIRSSVDIYNAATNSMSPGQSMGVPRALASVVEMDGDRLLVAGGISNVTVTEPGTPTATAEVLDLMTGTWVATPGQMATARGIHASFDIGGKRYLHVAGASGDILNPVALNTTEIYDDNTNTWMQGPVMVHGTAGYGYLSAPTGQIHILGGASGMPPAAQRFTEWFYR